MHVPKTRAEKVAKTVRFFPRQATLPENDRNEQLLESALKLSNMLQSEELNNLPDSSPDAVTAIKKLADMLLQKLQKSSNQNASPPRVKEALPPKQAQEPVPPPRVKSKEITAPSPSRPHAALETPREKRARIRNQTTRHFHLHNPSSF